MNDAIKQAIEALEAACGDRCNAEYNPCQAREAIAALRAQPAGWKLVPIEPTEEMRAAYFKAVRGACHPSHPYETYKAMLDASPLKQEMAHTDHSELSKTCGNCKHWERYLPPSKNSMATQNPDWTKRGECHAGLTDFIDSWSPGFSFDPPEEFSCKKWEEKV